MSERGTPFIQIRDLHHTYLAGTPLEATALCGADLNVVSGEIVGIMGRSGSGKSTLLQYCNGLLRPAQAGVVIIDGRDLADSDVDLRRLRQTVGLVLQHPEQQVFERLVGDDIAYGPKQMGCERPDVRERVQWAMAAVGLDFQTFVDRPTAALSGGERRKVALAGVLALRPAALALDESTTGLDPMAREGTLELLRQLNREEGMTILLVSSEMEEVAALADRVVVMSAGQTVLEGATAEVFSRADELHSWGLGQPATSAVLTELRRRGYAVDPRALRPAEAVEELCRILPS